MTVYINVTRQDMITDLRQSMFDDIEMNMDKLETVITNGFKGYDNYTDEELLKEYREYLSEDPDAGVVVTLVRGGTGFKREDV
jgi:hypothetical protein